MMRLHDRGHGPLDADPVAAHDRVHALAVRVQHRDAEGLGELVAELEDVPDLDRGHQIQGFAAAQARLPRRDLAQVGPRADGGVAADVHPAQVDIVDVGPGDHVTAVAQGLVRDHRQVRHAHRAQAAGERAQRVADLLGVRWAQRRRRCGIGQLLLVKRMVAAHEDQGQLAVEQVDQRLDLPVGRRVVRFGQVLDGPHAGGVEPLRGG